jgi:hypothetical protein
LGLSLYNAIELIVLLFGTFQRYHGLYFWSLFVAAFGIIPYSLGFIIKFFQLLDPNKDEGYVAVFLLTVGWYPMVTGKLLFGTQIIRHFAHLQQQVNPLSFGPVFICSPIRAAFFVGHYG